MKVPQFRYKIPVYFNDEEWHIINKDHNENFPLSIINPLTSIEVNLNSQWILASSPQDIINAAGSDYIVVKSNSNYNVNSGISVMYINFTQNHTTDSILKIMNRAESGYDYPIVTLDETTVLYNNTANTTAFTNFTVPSGEHTLEVIFRKDGSVNNDLDRAFLAIPDSGTVIIA